MAAESSPEAYLVQAMWSYASSVLEPAQILRRKGLSGFAARTLGEPPEPVLDEGLGAHFSSGAAQPVLLEESTEHDHLVEEFEQIGHSYEAVVRPYSRPIFEEGVSEFRDFLSPDARVLDAGCGPGAELREVARRVPGGEVVGVDLAAGMVQEAHRSARAHGIDNCAFYQADVGDLPDEFTGAFDLVYNCLAHHHYPEPLQAAEEISRALRPGGVYCIIDAGPEWFNRLSAPLAQWADPGWIGFHTPEEFLDLLRTAGFQRAWWVDTIPGFGVAVGQKARG